MDAVMREGLVVSVISYLAIFVVLAIFYGLIKVLLKALPGRPADE